jgi:molecular chaperone GrpE
MKSDKNKIEEKAEKKSKAGKVKPAKNKGEKSADLQTLVDELTKEKAELFEQLQRVSADYANFQKRAPKQLADSVAYEKKAIIKSLLPSLDNFELALNAAKTAESLDSVVEGIQLVFDHMLDALKTHGVEPINAAGKEFDPAMHEALMQQAEPDQPENIVLQEFQRGYKVNDQVIRPSKVIVNKLPVAPPDIPPAEKAEHEPEPENKEEAEE